MNKKRIYIASDHRGVRLKTALVRWLELNGYEPADLGPVTEDRVNATDYAVQLAKVMHTEAETLGVLICGTGQAMAMTANRYKHIRAALCLNSFMATMARSHNNANVLVLGAELVGEGLAKDCLETFLKTTFAEGVYTDRCKLLSDLGGI